MLKSSALPCEFARWTVEQATRNSTATAAFIFLQITSDDDINDINLFCNAAETSKSLKRKQLW